MLASMRRWISRHAEHYVLAQSVADVEAAKREGKLAAVFDIEGGRAVEANPDLVEIFCRLGVCWMLIAYNKNNRLGGGCQEEDSGVERVGMVLCCSHRGIARRNKQWSTQGIR